MLEVLEYVYNVIENLQEKGYEIIGLNIQENKVTITSINLYGTQTKVSFNVLIH